MITRVDRIDFGYADDGKTFEYVYRFATYEIRVGERVLAARRYADTWHEVSFFGGAEMWTRIPYDDAAFSIAARYFLGLRDVTRGTAFVQGEYRPVDPAVIAGTA